MQSKSGVSIYGIRVRVYCIIMNNIPLRRSRTTQPQRATEV